jgi:hypothetical protein
MNSSKGPADFKLPPDTEEPWNRLLQGGGTRSDLKSVLSLIAKLWAFDESDPRGFDEWLSSHGVPTGLSKGYPPPPPAIMAEYKQRFEREKRAKVGPTQDLLAALAVGPHSAEFFASFAGFSSELKILAYRTAISDYRNEGIVFALSAASQENRWIVEEATKGLPDSPVLELFSSYLKGARLPLAFAEGPVRARQSQLPIDHLFDLSTIPFREMVNAARPDCASSVRLAELLFKQLPDRGFGQFVRLNVAVFICLVAPQSETMDLAKRVLIATGEPSVADVLALMGKDQLLSELRN